MIFKSKAEFDDEVNTRVSECFAIINAAHEDKVAELELLAESSVRRRDLAEQCEDGMSRICAEQRNEIRRLRGEL